MTAGGSNHFPTWILSLCSCRCSRGAFGCVGAQPESAWTKVRFPQPEHIGDAAHRKIGGREFRDEFTVESIVALANEDGNDAVAPFSFDRGEDADFVIEEHVTSRREAVLDISQLAFLVNVHQSVAMDRFQQTGGLDLVRLEDDVAIAENGGGAPSTDMFDSFERFSTEPFGETIIEEETGELKQVEIVRIFEPIFL